MKIQLPPDWKERITPYITQIVISIIAILVVLFGVNVAAPAIQAWLEPAPEIGAQAVVLPNYKDGIRAKLVSGADGTATAPTYTFYADANTGFYRIGADNLGAAVGGSKVLDLASTGLGITGKSTVSTFDVWTPTTAITVTDGVAFAPTGVFQKIQAAGTVTPTVTVNTTAGTRVCLLNITAQDIIIADASTTMLGAARTLNQYDILCLISDATNWYEIGFYNN